MPGRRAIAGIGTATLVLAAVAWCSVDRGPDDRDDGVTAIDDTEARAVPARCVRTDPAGALVLYPGSLTVSERTLLTSVSLDGAENLDVIEEAVVAYRGPRDLQGVVTSYPPRETSFLGALTDWESRRPLAGLVVRPRDDKQAVLVAVRLEDPDRPGRLRGVTVEARTPAGPRAFGWEQLVLAVPHDVSCTPEAVAETTEWTG